MKHQMRSTKDGSLHIDVEVSDDEKAKAMSSFEACQNGQCGCPTDAYSRVKKMELAVDENSITINLESKDGTTIDAADVEKCMTWTKDQLHKK